MNKCDLCEIKARLISLSGDFSNFIDCYNHNISIYACVLSWHTEMLKALLKYYNIKDPLLEKKSLSPETKARLTEKIEQFAILTEDPFKPKKGNRDSYGLKGGVISK